MAITTITTPVKISELTALTDLNNIISKSLPVTDGDACYQLTTDIFKTWILTATSAEIATLLTHFALSYDVNTDVITYTPFTTSNFINSANFVAESLTPSINNALFIIDKIVNENYLYTVTKTITNSELKTIGTVPVVILAAPTGGTKPIRILQEMYIIITHGAVPMECGSQNLNIKYNDDAGYISELSNTQLELAGTQSYRIGFDTKNIINNKEIIMQLSSITNPGNASTMTTTMKLIMKYKDIEF